MSWNQETKNRLNEKVAQIVHDVGSLVRHVVKTSKSSEVRGNAHTVNWNFLIIVMNNVNKISISFL